MITSLIKKYILPKEVDFISSLEKQSYIISSITQDLYLCFIEESEDSCEAIIHDEHEAKKIRKKNMKELISTFITPIDKESIYRVITQLDWIALSIRHFVLEARAYEIKKLDSNYADMLKSIQTQSTLLNIGFKNIKISPKIVMKNTQEIRNNYDYLTDLYIKRVAKLSKSNNIQEIFIHKELLSQLKEISKRMQICANFLEDIIIKMS